MDVSACEMRVFVWVFRCSFLVCAASFRFCHHFTTFTLSVILCHCVQCTAIHWQHCLLHYAVAECWCLSVVDGRRTTSRPGSYFVLSSSSSLWSLLLFYTYVRSPLDCREAHTLPHSLSLCLCRWCSEDCCHCCYCLLWLFSFNEIYEKRLTREQNMRE